MRIRRDHNRYSIVLDQTQYANQVLKLSVLTIVLIKVLSIGDENLPDQKLIGTLVYLAVLTRPDI